MLLKKFKDVTKKIDDTCNLFSPAWAGSCSFKEERSERRSQFKGADWETVVI